MSEEEHAAEPHASTLTSAYCVWPPSTPGFWESNPKGWTIGSDPRVQRGHLLARQLGGAGDDRRNLVPLYAAVNSRRRRRRE